MIFRCVKSFSDTVLSLATVQKRVMTCAVSVSPEGALWAYASMDHCDAGLGGHTEWQSIISRPSRSTTSIAVPSSFPASLWNAIAPPAMLMLFLGLAQARNGINLGALLVTMRS